MSLPVNSGRPSVLTESPLVRRLMWNLVPLAIIVAAVGTTLTGADGLLNRHGQKQRLHALQAQVEQVEVRNAELRDRIHSLHQEPLALQREAAQQLLLAPPGATLYRFGSDSSSP